MCILFPQRTVSLQYVIYSSLTYMEGKHMVHMDRCTVLESQGRKMLNIEFYKSK